MDYKNTPRVPVMVKIHKIYIVFSHVLPFSHSTDSNSKYILIDSDKRGRHVGEVYWHYYLRPKAEEGGLARPRVETGSARPIHYINAVKIV